MPPTRTAAALIIGNELLTGKIQEGNLAFLGQELFRLGISMRRVVMCSDEVDVIAADLNALRAAHDIVFTSGGVGPTHDDVTLIAVAKAFGRALTRAESIARLISDYHGARTTEDHLRMADVPEGARLIASEQVRWPTVVVDNVYVFPGVPEIFRMKFPVVREELTQGGRFYSRAVFTRCDEGSIAAALAAVAARYPDTFVGSYPRFRDPDHTLKLTVDGADEALVGRAMDDIIAFLPADKIVRLE